AALPGGRRRPRAARRRTDNRRQVVLAGAARMIRGGSAAGRRRGEGEDSEYQGEKAGRWGGWESHGFSRVRAGGRERTAATAGPRSPNLRGRQFHDTPRRAAGNQKRGGSEGGVCDARGFTPGSRMTPLRGWWPGGAPTGRPCASPGCNPGASFLVPGPVSPL